MALNNKFKDELLKIASRSGPYTEFDKQQPDFTKRIAADFLRDFAEALDNLKTQELTP